MLSPPFCIQEMRCCNKSLVWTGSRAFFYYTAISLYCSCYGYVDLASTRSLPSSTEPMYVPTWCNVPP